MIDNPPTSGKASAESQVVSPCPIESLESRIAPATFEVTSTADAGDGSLRQAIFNANAASNVAHEIIFDFDTPGIDTISLRSTLPIVTASVTWIADAERQADGKPGVEIDGRSVAVASPGLEFGAGTDQHISGLAIYGFSGTGVVVGGKATIEDCFIGVAADGATPIANGGDGIRVGGTGELTLRSVDSRTLISGNVGNGILNLGQILEMSGTFVGLDITGARDLGNGLNGIRLEGPGTIGSSSQTQPPNVIAGNGANGIEALFMSYIGRNYVGTTADGLHALPNGQNGIRIENIGGAFTIQGAVVSGNRLNGIEIKNMISSEISDTLVGVGADGSTPIGNGSNGLYLNGVVTSSIFDNSVFSANTAAGVRIDGAIESLGMSGNRIGTDRSGTVAIANRVGIHVAADQRLEYSMSDLTLGGYNPNVISGNLADGILIESGTAAVMLHANYIGVDPAGLPLGNGGDGVHLKGEVEIQLDGATISANAGFGIHAEDVTGPVWMHNNSIGGLEPGQGNALGGISVVNSTTVAIGGGHGRLYGNLIAGNGGPGIVVIGSHRVGVEGNIFSANAGLPIDRGNDGRTPNSAIDADKGFDELQNFPVLTAAYYQGNLSTLWGTLASDTEESFYVGIYKVEGNTYSPTGLGSWVTPHPSGVTSFHVDVEGASPGSSLVALVSAVDGPSEMSDPVLVKYLAQVSQPGITLAEGDHREIALVVGLSGAADKPVTFNIASMGTASRGIDFEGVSEQVTVGAGQLLVDLILTIVDDPVVESNETIHLVFSSADPLVHLSETDIILEVVSDDSSLQILRGGREARWLDVDGDRVKLISSKPLLDAADFTFTVDPSTNGEHLVSLNLGADDSKGQGANLKFAAVAGSGGGNGTLDVGAIISNDVTLGTIKIPGELGSLDVTLSNKTRVGVKSLDVRSLSPGIADSSASTGLTIDGGLGSLRVHGDLIDVSIAATSIRSIAIEGSLRGSSLVQPSISALNGGIGSLRVSGDVTGYFIFATGGEGGARIDRIQVRGNWMTSSLVAGVLNGTDGLFGTLDDVLDTPPGDATSMIARIVIGGTIEGSLTAGDHYAIAAARIGSVKIGGAAVPLQSSVADVIELGTTGDFTLREVTVASTGPAEYRK